jgi:uncharacterized membrane protein YcaP (DUF421 family)
MASQLTRNELAAIVSLAAAIGVPILAPDRGLLPAIVITFVVVGISRLISLSSARNLKIENVTQGKMDTLVKDSVFNTEAMERTRITRERIMAHLRAEQILQLGEVERLYLEANGNFTTIRHKNPKPGLPVIPEKDKAFFKELQSKSDGILVCGECGYQNPGGAKDLSCPNCESKEWVAAIMPG